MNRAADAVKARPIVFAVPGPVFYKSQAFDILLRDISPEATVKGMIAVVPHDEIMSLRNPHRSEEIPWRGFFRQYVRILMDLFGDLIVLTIDINFFRTHLDLVTRQADYALDEILALKIVFVLIAGELENDHIIAFGIANRKK